PTTSTTTTTTTLPTTSTTTTTTTTTTTAPPPDAPIDSGTCGTDLRWTLDRNGNLKIFGTGQMSFENSFMVAPWREHAGEIKTVVMESGVTNIAEFAFEECEALVSVSIPDTVEEIEAWGFYDCSSLKSITIPASVKSIGASAFQNCSALKAYSVLNPDCEIPDNADEIPSQAMLYGYWNSTLAEYAKKYRRNFVAFSVHGVKNPQPTPKEIALGDADGNGKITAEDAAQILILAARFGSGQDIDLTPEQFSAADVNRNNIPDSGDAVAVLMYASAMGAGRTDVKIEDFI
ncbi:MAG TPA: hypothetical protein DCO72_00340, partial [Ruminococcus sp.]|nr:hypothetical protein [Ruminococcus sp.]